MTVGIKKSGAVLESRETYVIRTGTQENELRSTSVRSLLATMAKTTAKKRNRVKGVASGGRRRGWKLILIFLGLFLLIPAMQVAA